MSVLRFADKGRTSSPRRKTDKFFHVLQRRCPLAKCAVFSLESFSFLPLLNTFFSPFLLGFPLLLLTNLFVTLSAEPSLRPYPNLYRLHLLMPHFQSKIPTVLHLGAAADKKITLAARTARRCF